MFIDTARIHVASGRGGNGCNSFLRDRHISHPRPNGGPGGDGGDVIIRVNPHIHTLLDFQYKRHFKAQNGSYGSSNDKKGARGADCIINVPPGTVIKDASTGLTLKDLDTAGAEVIVCKGGKGGRGNAPRKEPLPGEPAEERELLFELKLIADIGIIGFPNAGKSTFISKISSARPKIADYPFTTRAPVLGIVGANGRSPLRDGRRFVVCEIPGLIEGAHVGKGLGIKFLRHAERTKILIHLVDMAAVEGRDPVEDYRIINREIKFYSDEFYKKPQIVAANKMDQPQAEENLKIFKKSVKKKIYPISAVTGKGVRELLEAVWKELRP